ncbi:MAG: hypothetical protein AAF567_24505 [Actinomycetota bacterium]
MIPNAALGAAVAAWATSESSVPIGWLLPPEPPAWPHGILEPFGQTPNTRTLLVRSGHAVQDWRLTIAARTPESLHMSLDRVSRILATRIREIAPVPFEGDTVQLTRMQLRGSGYQRIPSDSEVFAAAVLLESMITLT